MIRTVLFILLAFAAAGCIGIKTGDGPEGPSLSSYSQIDVLFSETTSLQGPAHAVLKSADLQVLNDSGETASFIYENNSIHIYAVSPGWYSIFFGNSLKFKVKADSEKRTLCFVDFSHTVLDTGYIDLNEDIYSYLTDQSGNFSKIVYSCKGTIHNGIFISNEIKMYKKGSSEEITENMIDSGTAAVLESITANNFSELPEYHRKKMLEILTGNTNGYETFTDFNAKIINTDLYYPVITGVTFQQNGIALDSLTSGQIVDCIVGISNKSKVQMKILQNNNQIFSEDVEGLSHSFSASGILIRNSYIQNAQIVFTVIAKDSSGNIAFFKTALPAQSASGTVDFNISDSGTKIIQSPVRFTFDTTKTRNGSVRSAITSGTLYFKWIQKSNGAILYPDSFSESSYKGYYKQTLSSLSSDSTGIYFFEKSFEHYGHYDYACYIEDAFGTTSEVQTGYLKIAKSSEYIGDIIEPDFYFSFRNVYGGKIVLYDSSNEVMIDTNLTSSGILSSNREQNLRIYVKIERPCDGLVYYDWKEYSSSTGKYYSYQRMKQTGYFNITVACTDFSGNTSVQKTSTPIFVGKQDSIAPVFTVTVTDESGNAALNVGDKVKLHILTEPNEGQAYLKADIVSSGETKNIYSERVVSFDSFGAFTDVSGRSITSSYENQNLVGVRFDVVITLKDMAGNSTVKYIPSVIEP